MPGPLSCTPTLKRLGPVVSIWTQISGRMPASSQASSDVVDGFLDRGEQRLAGVVEAQQVAVLGEELADGNIALAGGHRFGRGPALVNRGGLGAAVGAGGRVTVGGMTIRLLTIARRMRFRGRVFGGGRFLFTRRLGRGIRATLDQVLFAFDAGQCDSSAIASRDAILNTTALGRPQDGVENPAKPGRLGGKCGKK